MAELCRSINSGGGGGGQGASQGPANHPLKFVMFCSSASLSEWPKSPAELPETSPNQCHNFDSVVCERRRGVVSNGGQSRAHHTSSTHE